MSYCDYDYYTNEYYGNIITEDDFPRYVDRASDKLDKFIFGRLDVDVSEIENDVPITSTIPSFTTTIPSMPVKYAYNLYYSDTEEPLDVKLEKKVKKAVCKLAEILYDIDMAEKASRESIGFEKSVDGQQHGKLIKSISSGSESITYSEGNTASSSLVGAVLTDKKTQEQLFFDTIRDYLTGTGLLYAGI